MHLPPHPLAHAASGSSARTGDDLVSRGHRAPRRSRSAIALASLLALFALACASPAPPRPPSLHLPRIPSDLTAERIGDQVRVHWTTSNRTTDDLPAPSALTAELCRETAPAATTAAPPAAKTTGSDPACTVVAHLSVAPGPSSAAETLPAALSSGTPALLRYRLRVLNGDGRSAGYTRTVLAPSGAAPSPVLQLRAAPGRNGAIVSWTPSTSPSIVELTRRLDQTPQQEQARKAAQKSSPLAPDDPTEARLRSADVHTSPSAPDPGGVVDRGVQRGESYTYRAQRLQPVQLNGQSLELRSELSAPVTLRNTDTFAPNPPSGLATVPSSSQGHSAIDLSWQPDDDNDLAGYNVYRRQPDGRFVRLNAAPVTGPAYTDATTAPGASYTYRVTAIDTTGNESIPSSEASETAQQP